MKKIWFLLLLGISLSGFGQNNSNDKSIDLRKGSIKEKFNTLYSKSNNYKNYKVIKQYLLVQLKQQVLDSLKQQKEAYAKTTDKIKKLEAQITDLQLQLKQANEQISKLENEKDSIGFLGFPVQKTKYQMIMWSIVIFLLLGLFYFIFMFKNSLKGTKIAQNNLRKIEEEYNNFRTNALEREQLLKRQLLDEKKKHQV